MNILYLNHYAGGPSFGMEFRPFYLSREWVRSGHRVRILAASYSHVRARQPAVPVDAGGWWPETHDGVNYAWYRTPAYSGNDAGRAMNIGVFLGRVALDGRRIAREFAPQIVIASSTYPMDIWVARRIAQIAGARLVFELHDLWPLSLVELSGMSPRHPFAMLCALAERAAFRHSDIVISMLPNVSDYAESRGTRSGRLHVVPNGVSPEDWEKPPEPLRADVAEFLVAQKKAGRIIIGYAGAHGRPNALDVLLDAAELLRDFPVAFALVGDGLERARLAVRLGAKPTDRVRMFGSIPKGQIPGFLQNIDVAYIGWRRSPLYRFGIAPNKLLDYMMSGRPVLHAVEAGNDPVAEAGCGLTVAPESPRDLAAGLRQLIGMSPEARLEMGLRGREYVLQSHSYPVLAQRFLEACGA